MPNPVNKRTPFLKLLYYDEILAGDWLGLGRPRYGFAARLGENALPFRIHVLIMTTWIDPEVRGTGGPRVDSSLYC